MVAASAAEPGSISLGMPFLGTLLGYKVWSADDLAKLWNFHKVIILLSKATHKKTALPHRNSDGTKNLGFGEN